MLLAAVPVLIGLGLQWQQGDTVLPGVSVAGESVGGVSREQLGAWLMQCWNMPEELAVALRYQHDSSYSGEHAAYANLVYMTTRLLREQGIGDAPPETIPKELFRKYGLHADEARLAIAHVAQSADIRHMAEQLASAGS